MAKRLRLTPSLTRGYSDEIERQLAVTYEGMAFFADTGPFGETCGNCSFFGYYKVEHNLAGAVVSSVRVRGCAKFKQLTGKNGPPIPAGAAACKYFERKESDT
jgi:hypothetical protein